MRIVLIKTVESLQEFILLWGQLHAVVSQALPQLLDALERLVGANQFAGHNDETKALLDGAGIQCLGLGVHGWARVKKLAGADQIARLQFHDCGRGTALLQIFVLQVGEIMGREDESAAQKNDDPGDDRLPLAPFWHRRHGV